MKPLFQVHRWRENKSFNELGREAVSVWVIAWLFTFYW